MIAELKYIAGAFLFFELGLGLVSLVTDKFERKNMMRRSLIQVIHRKIPFPLNWIVHTLSVICVVILISP